MSHMGIGLQLYSVRRQLQEDFQGTLRKVADAGYEGVEFAGLFGGMAAEELRSFLDEIGLKAIGNHTGIYQLRDDLAGQIAYLKALGAPTAIAPWLPEEFRSAEAFGQLLAILEPAAKAFSEAGILFGYHNHDFEFREKLDGMYLLDALFARTAALNVQAELDVGWVYRAGEDPVAYVKKYSGRLPLVHLKDFVHTASDEWFTCPVGKGNTPMADVIETAKSTGTQWLIVEQDETDGDIFEDITFSRGWLKEQYR